MKKPNEIAKKLLFLNKNEKKKYFIKILTNKVIIYPGGFSPKYFNDTELFAKYLPFKKGSHLLEIGTGTGIIAINAILNGKLKKVTATDISSNAIKNTKENIRIYKLNKKINIIKSDLFKKLKNKKFNTIFFNAPFSYTKKKNLTILEKSLYDYKYKTLNNFIRDCKKYIKKDGHIYLGFSSFFGNSKELNKILDYNKRKIKVIKRIDSKREGQKVNLEILEII